MVILKPQLSYIKQTAHSATEIETRMAAREIRINQLCEMLRRFGLFAMSLSMSHFLHYFGMTSPATQEPSSAFAAFFMWILGIWLVMLSCAIPVLPGGRRIAAQIVEFVEQFVLGFRVDLLF